MTNTRARNLTPAFFHTTRPDLLSNVSSSLTRPMTDIYTCFPNSLLPLSEEYEELFAAFQRTNLTSVDLLTMDAREVARVCNRSVVEIRRFLAEFEVDIKQSLKKGPESAFHLRKRQYDVIQFDVPRETAAATTLPSSESVEPTSAQNTRSVSSSSATLNDVIGGGTLQGIPLGSVTEIVGCSSVGKSHFLLQLSATVQLRYTKRAAIYITTESSGIETRRLQDIVARVASQCASNGQTFHAKRISTDNVHMFSCLQDTEELLHVLKYQVPVLIERHDVGLVVIDSIAAHFRGMGLRRRGEQNEHQDTYQLLRAITTCLKQLAITKRVAVVVANQVADRFWKKFNYSAALATRARKNHTQRIGNSLSSFALMGHSIEALMADHQIRWYSGWTNICLMAQGGPLSARLRPIKVAREEQQNDFVPVAAGATKSFGSATDFLRRSISEQPNIPSQTEATQNGQEETQETQDVEVEPIPKKQESTIEEDVGYHQQLVQMSMAEDFEDFDGEEGRIIGTAIQHEDSDSDGEGASADIEPTIANTEREIEAENDSKTTNDQPLDIHDREYDDAAPRDGSKTPQIVTEPNDSALGVRIYTQESHEDLDTPRRKKRRILSVPSSQQCPSSGSSLPGPSFSPNLPNPHENTPSPVPEPESEHESGPDASTRSLNLAAYYNATDPGIFNYDSGKVPALGLIWASQVDQRIVLKKTRDGRRFMQVVFSPWSDGNRQEDVIDTGEDPFDEDDAESVDGEEPDPFLTVNPVVAEEASLDPGRDAVEFEIWQGGIRGM